MSPPDRLTILRTRGLPATKTLGPGPDGRPTITSSYGDAKRFAVRQEPIDGLDDLAAALDRVRWDEFVIRGEPEPGIDWRGTLRRLHPDPGSGEPATFREAPRRWLLLDFDSLPAQPGLDPLNGPAVAAFARSTLPSCRSAACWWQLTSSAGIAPGFRVRLGLWLDRPVGRAFLDRWLAHAPVDATVFRTVQPIYVARPILRGVPDPMPVRAGVLEGHDAAVTVPELPPLPPRPARSTHAADGRRYVSGAPRSTAERRLEALCRAVSRAGPGSRHRCLVWAAARAVELDDAISRAEIAAGLIAAARAAGLEEPDGELERQVRNGFRIGVFGAAGAAA
jgi:hypothetical protein